MSTDFMFRGFEMQPELCALRAERFPPPHLRLHNPSIAAVPQPPGAVVTGKGGPGRQVGNLARVRSGRQLPTTAPGHPQGQPADWSGAGATGDPEPEGQSPQTAQATEQA